MATAAATSAAVTVGKWGCGGRNLRRRAMQLQLRGPQKSAPQRNSSFEHQLATSVRMASAPMGEQHTRSNCSKCTRVIAEHAWQALKRAYIDAGFFGLFFFCAMRQNMQKPCPHFRVNSDSVLSHQGMPQQGLRPSCIAARVHLLGRRYLNARGRRCAPALSAASMEARRVRANTWKRSRHACCCTSAEGTATQEGGLGLRFEPDFSNVENKGRDTPLRPPTSSAVRTAKRYLF
jgi:hypothetical protein